MTRHRFTRLCEKPESAARNELLEEHSFAEACDRIARSGFEGEDETSPWDRLIERHAGVIRHVHLNDEAGKAPSLWASTREDRVRFVAAFAALRAAGYRGWVSLEVFEVSDSVEVVLGETRSFLSWVEGELGR